MSYRLVIAEKPSVAQAYAKVLGATNRNDGYLEGNGYLVSWCIGHLVELAPPNVYDEKYVKWSIADLPILPQKWQYLVSTSTKKQFGILQKLMNHPDVDSIVCATDAGEHCEQLRCRIVRLGDSRERKKRPHLVKKLNHKSIKEGIQMKQNRIFDQNSSQKARSWHYNMDTNRAEAQFADGSAIAIDCLAIEDEYGNTPAQRAELDWLLYNKPLECVQLVLSGEIEHYLSLGCDHGKLKD